MESCLNRSCMKGLNLQCINKTCRCSTNDYYLKMCVSKIDYLQKFSKNRKCKETLNCLSGVCNCNDSMFWNGEKCSNKATINESCLTDEMCTTSRLLYCEKSQGICTCMNNRYKIKKF